MSKEPEGISVRVLPNGKVLIVSYEGGRGPFVVAAVYPTSAVQIASQLIKAAKFQSAKWSTKIPDDHRLKVKEVQ